ncbi:MAG: hypothetical protein U0S12_14985 [Fimbriimonadales bacterium]
MGKERNPQGVVSLIESASDDAPNWTQIAVTTKTRITLEGVTPGVPRLFESARPRTATPACRPSRLGCIHHPLVR